MAYQAIPPGSGSDAFYTAQSNFMRGLGLGLTRFVPVKIGLSLMGSTLAGTADGATEGGARTGGAGVPAFMTTSIFQTPKTGKWSVAMRAKLAAPVSGRGIAVGLINGAGSHDIFCGSYFAVSQTKYVLLCDGTSSTTDITTTNVDALYHVFCLSGDGTNVRMYIDGVIAATRAIGTNVVEEPVYVALFNTTVSDAIMADCIYGYIA